MNFFRRPEPVPVPVLVERTPFIDAEMDALLANPEFVADFIAWRERQG